jgi:hypothetical protein
MDSRFRGNDRGGKGMTERGRRLMKKIKKIIFLKKEGFLEDSIE